MQSRRGSPCASGFRPPALNAAIHLAAVMRRGNHLVGVVSLHTEVVRAAGRVSRLTGPSSCSIQVCHSPQRVTERPNRAQNHRECTLLRRKTTEVEALAAFSVLWQVAVFVVVPLEPLAQHTDAL